MDERHYSCQIATGRLELETFEKPRKVSLGTKNDWNAIQKKTCVLAQRHFLNVNLCSPFLFHIWRDQGQHREGREEIHKAEENSEILYLRQFHCFSSSLSAVFPVWAMKGKAFHWVWLWHWSDNCNCLKGYVIGPQTSGSYSIT